jgi:hypothetical protein
VVSGTNPINLHFPGGLIRQLEVDGPYQVEALSLSDGSGTTLDYMALAHVTGPYSHTQFAMPLVVLTDHYRDYPADTNADAIPDVLKVDIGLLPGNNGVVIAQAQLADKNGAEIGWSSASVPVTNSVPATVTLVYSASQILTHGVDGPYLVRNLLVYHAGDPTQDVTVDLAHITAPYNHTNLQPLFIIGPPASVAVQIQPTTLPADGVSQAAVLVTVKDGSGNTIPNQLVNLVASSGSLAPSSAKTDINGTITVSLTASTAAGTGVVTASIGALSGNGSITFVPGAPAELTLVVNPTQVSADGASVISVTALVKDAYGNNVSGQAVSFSASAGTIGTSATTNGAGAAATQLVAPASKTTASVTASVGGLAQSAQVEFRDEEIFMPHLERQ